MLPKAVLINNAQIDVNRARGMLTRVRKHFWRRARLKGTDVSKMQRLNKRLQEAEYNLSAANSWVEPPSPPAANPIDEGSDMLVRGEMKWFGDSTLLRVVRPDLRVEVPAGKLCCKCHEPIQKWETGYVVAGAILEAEYHNHCFERDLDGPQEETL